MTQIEEVQKRVYSAKELVISPVDKPEFLIRNVIPKKGITIVGGDSGTGKTILSVLLALSGSVEKPLLNKFGVDTKLRVLIYDEENQKDITALRIKTIVDGHNIDLEEENVFFSITAGITFTKSHIKKIIEDIETYKPNLIVLDSLVRFIDGNEDKSGDMKQVFNIIKPLIKKYGVSFLILHHTVKGGKGAKQDLRGSGDLAAFADIIFMLQSEEISGEKLFILKQVKNRIGKTIPAVGYNIKTEEDFEGNIVSSQFVINPNYDENIDLAQYVLQEDIFLWLSRNKIDEFKTADLKTALEKNPAINDTNIFYGAINQLKKIKVLKSIKKGYYKVNLDII